MLGSTPGDAIQHLSASLAPINAGNGLQIRQGLLAEAALVGLGAMLRQPVQRLGRRKAAANPVPIALDAAPAPSIKIQPRSFRWFSQL
jgi:hypothetical protein